MSFLYPRTIDVRRAKTIGSTTDAIGDVGYSGEESSTAASDPQGEIVLLTKIPCSIQADSPGRPSGTMLPQDVTARSRWKIFIPSAAATKGTIRDRDIIVDDLGNRYEVAQDYWNSLGHSLICVRLEA